MLLALRGAFSRRVINRRNRGGRPWQRRSSLLAPSPSLGRSSRSSNTGSGSAAAVGHWLQHSGSSSSGGPFSGNSSGKVPRTKPITWAAMPSKPWRASTRTIPAL